MFKHMCIKGKTFLRGFYSWMRDYLTINAYFCNCKKLFYKLWRFISALSGYVDFPVAGAAEIFVQWYISYSEEAKKF